MSERIDDKFYVAMEPPGLCAECGELKELRPYGKDGAEVCFECAMKDPHEARRQFVKRFVGVDTVVAPAEYLSKARLQ